MIIKGKNIFLVFLVLTAIFSYNIPENYSYWKTSPGGNEQAFVSPASPFAATVNTDQKNNRPLTHYDYGFSYSLKKFNSIFSYQDFIEGGFDNYHTIFYPFLESHFATST